MNRDQKAAVVAEVATQIQESEAVFAVDYRGISVPQAAELRVKLNDAGARFRVVKNTLTELAADRAGADSLKDVLDGPTAFTFVASDGGDVALAAKALAQFRRETDLLEFKGGVMGGEALSAEQIGEIARLPAKDVLYGQVVGMIASPITGLVRVLNALIAGLAIQLQQIAEQGLVPVEGAGAAASGGEEPAAGGSASGDEEGAPAEPSESESGGDSAPGNEEGAPAGASESESGGGSAPGNEEGAPAAASDSESGGDSASEGPSAEADQAAQADQAEEEAAQSAQGEETESSGEESAPAGDDTNESETPSEGDEKE
jgi:large subunit ribosomal protein L10